MPVISPEHPSLDDEVVQTLASYNIDMGIQQPQQFIDSVQFAAQIEPLLKDLTIESTIHLLDITKKLLAAHSSVKHLYAIKTVTKMLQWDSKIAPTKKEWSKVFKRLDSFIYCSVEKETQPTEGALFKLKMVVRMYASFFQKMRKMDDDDRLGLPDILVQSVAKAILLTQAPYIDTVAAIAGVGEIAEEEQLSATILEETVAVLQELAWGNFSLAPTHLAAAFNSRLAREILSCYMQVVGAYSRVFGFPLGARALLLGLLLYHGDTLLITHYQHQWAAVDSDNTGS